MPVTPVDSAKAARMLPVVGADPAAGAEVLFTVPAAKAWQVMSALVPFVASATAATRSHSLVADDGTTVFARVGAGAQTVANDDRIFTWSRGAILVNQGIAGGTVGGALWDIGPLAPGFRIRTITLNLQAGDNYGVPVLYVAEYDL